MEGMGTNNQASGVPVVRPKPSINYGVMVSHKEQEQMAKPLRYGVMVSHKENQASHPPKFNSKLGIFQSHKEHEQVEKRSQYGVLVSHKEHKASRPEPFHSKLGIFKAHKEGEQKKMRQVTMRPGKAMSPAAHSTMMAWYRCMGGPAGLARQR